MRTLEEATTDMVNAQQRLQAHQMMNVYGRTNQELIGMEVERQRTIIAFNRAKAEVDEIVRLASNPNQQDNE